MRSSRVPWQGCYAVQFLGVTGEEAKQLAATFSDVRLLTGMSQAQGQLHWLLHRLQCLGREEVPLLEVLV